MHKKLLFSPSILTCSATSNIIDHYPPLSKKKKWIITIIGIGILLFSILFVLISRHTPGISDQEKPGRSETKVKTEQTQPAVN